MPSNTTASPPLADLIPGSEHREMNFPLFTREDGRDGCHEREDPIICEGLLTTLLELGSLGRLEGRLVPSEAIPPYLSGGKQAYMAALKGQAKGWEVTMGTFDLLFLSPANGINRSVAVQRFLERQKYLGRPAHRRIAATPQSLIAVTQ